MINLLLVLFGKTLSQLSQILNLGNGSTWPGHIALFFHKNFISQQASNNNLKTIVIAGTNGKTTTSKLIKHLLESAGKKVIHNESGANLLNGIASSLILNTNAKGNINAEFAIFEADENTLPLLLQEITPDYIVLLNLFRDQLDRYGEVDSIAKNWDKAIKKLPAKTVLILNADDPEVAYIGENKNVKILYFGLNLNGEKKSELEHAADSIYCPRCNSALTYSTTTLSHLGNWQCKTCSLKRPSLTSSQVNVYPLAGTYNRYNTLAAFLLVKTMGISEQTIDNASKTFTPVFGRQEILTYNDKNVQIFLSKNPTGFNESLKTIKTFGAKNVLFILNDNIADGRDVSWIWDIDTEILINSKIVITISGTRAYDMGLRIKYSMETHNLNLNPSADRQNYSEKLKIFKNIKEAIDESIKVVHTNETLYILSTYTAMLEVRKVITGKKIL